MAVGSFFFSAARTAQNSPELHFRFIDSPIQSSVLKSVLTSYVDEIAFEPKRLGSFHLY